MKIGVIGCGITGLASIQSALQYGAECVAFERSGDIGGFWRYDERTGVDEFNNRIQANCYESLRSQLPKFLMEYRKFRNSPKSHHRYLHHEEINKYLEDYVDEFNLRPHIKFYHQVIKVMRVNNSWIVEVLKLRDNVTEQYVFDGVMVCNGHYTEPLLPKIEGMNSFTGHQMHSSSYRRNVPFSDKRVLIIGAGKSGLEISHECLKVAQKVTLSQGTVQNVTDLSPKVQTKPRTVAMRDTRVYFEDGTSSEVDVIIYCTGYKYYFPFLDESCGIEIENHSMVTPLWMQFVNIHHPSMCFVGLIKYVPVFWMAEFQAETYMKYMTNRIKLPSTGEMFDSLEAENRYRILDNRVKKSYHLLTSRLTEEYFEELIKFARLAPLPPVYYRINDYLFSAVIDRFITTKKLKFTILDDYNFTISLMDE